MKSNLKKWLIGIFTSILVGLFMWWVTNKILEKPELTILDLKTHTIDNICEVNVTLFNTGKKLAKDCRVSVEFFVDTLSKFPYDYDDLLKLDRLEIAWSDKFFILPNERKEITVKNYYSKELEVTDVNVYRKGYLQIPLWTGISLEYGNKQIKELGPAEFIYISPDTNLEDYLHPKIIY